MKKSLIFLGLVSFSVFILSACQRNSKTAETSAIQNVITINDSFGDGQKVCNVALEYPEAIDPNSLDISSFIVLDRTITAIHTNSKPDQTNKDTNGNYIILDLEIQSPLLDDQYATDGRIKDNQVIDSVTVVQKKAIKTLSGKIYHASKKHVSTPEDSGIMGNLSKIYLTRDKFEDNHFYYSKNWNVEMHYNIYIPEDTSDNLEKSYPLVIFMPDAGSVSSDWETVLTQGNGGTIWASDNWQANYPCIVATMIYDDKFINDYWEYYDAYIGGTLDLVHHLSETLPVDSKHIYTTGQSMGCMASMIMMNQEPDLFAAGFLVAGKWDPSSLTNLTNSKLIILNSEDDSLETNKLMDEAVSLWENNGASVKRETINGVATINELEESLSTLTTSNASILYCKIASGTGSMDKVGKNLNGSHRMTWRLAYDLPLVKEWLFNQSN